MDAKERATLTDEWQLNEAELERLWARPVRDGQEAALEARQDEIASALGDEWIERFQAGDRQPPVGWEFSDKFFRDVLFQTVPEQRWELGSLIATHGISFEADERCPVSRFRVDPKSKVVFVTTTPMSRLWAQAWSYLEVYSIVSEHAGKGEASITGELQERISRAQRLHDWATQEDIRAQHAWMTGEPYQVTPVPTDLPQPFNPQNPTLLESLATHLTLMSLGGVFLHEIGHLVLGHAPSSWPESVRQEFDADAWAAHMLLDRLHEYVQRRYSTDTQAALLLTTKRLEAFAVGFLWAIKYEVLHGVREKGTHPPSFERLYVRLADAEPNADGLLWAFAYVVFGLHLHGSGVAVDPMASRTFKERVSAQCDAISRIRRA